MKKFNIIAAVFAMISAVVFLSGIVFGLFVKEEVAPYSVIYALFAAASIATFVILLKGKKNGIMVLPFLFLIALPLVFTQVETGNSVLNSKILYIVVIALYVTALVFATTKNAKWAAVVVLVLTVLVTFEKLAPAVNTYNTFVQSANAYSEALNASTSLPSSAVSAYLQPYANEMFLNVAYTLGYFGMVYFGVALIIFASGLTFTKEEPKESEATTVEVSPEE